MSDFIKEYSTRILDRIPEKYLAVVIKELELHCADYNIERACKEVAPCTDWLPPCLKPYFVDRIIAGYSKQTLKLSRNYLEHFFNTVRKPLDDIDSNDLKLYLYNTQAARGLSNRTLDSRRAILAVFFRWANAEGYILKDPTRNIKRIKYEVKPREPLSPKEREKVRLACKDLRDKTLFEVFYSTGARVGEVCNLRWQDINLDTREIHLFGKGNKWRTTYLSERAIVLLARYFKECHRCEYVFCPERGTARQPKSRAIEQQISNIGERSGIGRKLFPHLIRHTTATDLVNHGMTLPEVQKCMGHERIETTMVYTHINNDQTRADHGKFLA